MEVLIIIIMLVFMMWGASKIAESKNRSIGGWVFLVFLFGVFAFAILVCLPTIPTTRETIPGDEEKE